MRKQKKLKKKGINIHIYIETKKFIHGSLNKPVINKTQKTNNKPFKIS